MSQVTKAVIPAAGHGTRMQPISLVLPKELLPVGTRPMIQFAVEEAIEGGIREVVIVINTEKELIRSYFEKMQDQPPFESVTFRFQYQEEANGLADAIDCCRPFVEGEPFALLLPDNVVFSQDYRLSSLVELYNQSHQHVVGVIELGVGQSGLYGNVGRIEYETLESGVLMIKRLYGKEKGTLEIDPGRRVLRTCGRYICHSDLFRYIDLLRPKTVGEFDEVPVYQEIVSRGKALGYVIPGPLFDTGNPKGYLAASSYLEKHWEGGD